VITLGGRNLAVLLATLALLLSAVAFGVQSAWSSRTIGIVLAAGALAVALSSGRRVRSVAWMIAFGLFDREAPGGRVVRRTGALGSLLALVLAGAMIATSDGFLAGGGWVRIAAGQSVMAGDPLSRLKIDLPPTPPAVRQ